MVHNLWYDFDQLVFTFEWGEQRRKRRIYVLAKDTWEFEIKRHCMYNNGMQVCRFPFSISYGNKEYEVKEDYLQL